MDAHESWFVRDSWLDEEGSVTLSGLVLDNATATPDRECIVDVSRTWTWQEAADHVGRQGAALISAGVVPGDRVGVHLNKSAEGFLAMHAVVSVGAVAVPLDPGSPPERLARICSQMQISVVISHGPRRKSLEALHLLHPLRAVVGLVLSLSDEAQPQMFDEDAIAALDPVAPVVVKPDDVAYIVTTSGSTGEPKGIVHTHRSARAYAEMTLRTYDVNATDRIADISPHHFDISTLSLWSTPLAGATNVVINEAYQRLPASHSQLLQDHAVTLWYSVPFLLQQLVLRGDLANRDLTALRWVHFGGEVVPPEIIGAMMDHAPNARFANIFGPAETNQCSVAFFDSAPDIDRPLSVGFPLDHSEIRVVDPDAAAPTPENLMPVDVVGEMWAATPQLMEGYWGLDTVNDKVLKTVDGQRFYRTGDLVSQDASGELTFYGRSDHQVKVRGFRIELEGVEADLESLVQRDGSAENVVVSVWRQESGQDQVVAGVLGATDRFDQTDFMRAAASAVPTYAVPTQTVCIDSPTFTGSGKLDRRVLREQVLTALEERNNESMHRVEEVK